MAPAAQAPATQGGTPAPQPTQVDVDTAFSTAASLAAAGTDPADPAFQDAVNQLFSLTGLSQQEIMDRINQSAAVDPGAVGKAADAQIGSNILASQLYSELGTTGAELSGLLGIPEDQIANYTVDQLAAALGSVSQQTQGTAITAGSGLVGAAERGAAREQLQDLSRSGVMSLEDDLGELSGALERADSIQFGGRDWTVEELLGDGNISRLLTEYLLNPTSKSSQQFAADPQTKPLLDFAERYKTSLTAAAQQMGKAVSESERRVGENRALARIGEVDLPPELMTQIYGEGWDKRGATVQQPKGVVAALRALPADQQKAAVDGITEAFRKYPKAGAQIADLSPEQVQSLFSNNGAAWKSYTTALDYDAKLAELDTPEELASLLGASTVTELQDSVKQTADLLRLGLASEDRGLTSVLDTNRDGKVDDIAEIVERLRSATPALSLEQVLTPQDSFSSYTQQQRPRPLADMVSTVSASRQQDVSELSTRGFGTPYDLARAPIDSLPKDLLFRVARWPGEYGRAATAALANQEKEDTRRNNARMEQAAAKAAADKKKADEAARQKEARELSGLVTKGNSGKLTKQEESRLRAAGYVPVTTTTGAGKSTSSRTTWQKRK
jgi:hypothetical protein